MLNFQGEDHVELSLYCLRPASADQVVYAFWLPSTPIPIHPVYKDIHLRFSRRKCQTCQARQLQSHFSSASSQDMLR